MSVHRCIGLLLILVSVPAARALAQEGNAGEQEVVFPSFGVALTPPAGWERAPERFISQIGRWVKISRAANGQPILVAELTANVVPANGQSHRQYLDSKTGLFSGSIAESQTTLGASLAVRRVGSNAADGVRVEHISIARQSYFYDLLLIVRKGARADEARNVQQSWRWTDVQSPVDSLTPRREGVPILGGAVALRLPEAMRPWDGQGPTRAAFAAYNFRRGDADFIVQIELISLERELRLSDAMRVFASNISRNVKGLEPLKWTEPIGITPYACTQLLRLDIDPQKKPDAHCYTKWGLFQVDRNRFCVATITIGSPEPSDRSAYDSAADAMLQSLTVNLK